MFRKLLVVGSVFLTAACVPIAPEPVGPCISYERALLIGETVEAQPSDHLPGYIDIIKVESELYDQVLTVVFHLKDIPEELTFYREGMKTNRIEYSWIVLISESRHIEPWSDEVEKMTRFNHRLKTSHFAKIGEPILPTSGSIPSIANSAVWVLKRGEDREVEYPWYTQALWEARIDVSHEHNTLTMTGYVPGVTRESLLVFETYDFFHGHDRIRCESADGLAQKSPVSEVEIAIPPPPSPKADLNDLATMLARMDESDNSEEYSALLREFSDCFLSNLTAREREVGLGDDNESAITPAQITAVTLFQAGIFAVVGRYEQAQVVEQADPSPSIVNMYELLEGALAICEDSR